MLLLLCLLLKNRYKGFWPIIQQGIVNKNILKQYFPNIDLIEQGNIIGINTEGSAIIDDFIKAYFSLAPWDDWHDPEYLDKLLISPDKKPENLIYKNKCSIPTQSLSCY